MDDSFLAKTALFQGMNADEAREALTCLDAHEKKYRKGSVIFRAGNRAEYMAVMIAGRVKIEINDLWGNTTLLGYAEAGELFAESYACIPGEKLMVNAVAAENCTVLFLNAARLFHICAKTCTHHNLLIRNLLQIMAEKNLTLSRRSLHTSSKTIRSRLLSYLSEQAKRADSHQFTIPFNRQELADYLGVDRSALSGELGKMKRDGLIDFHKNSFLLTPEK